MLTAYGFSSKRSPERTFILDLNLEMLFLWLPLFEFLKLLQTGIFQKHRHDLMTPSFQPFLFPIE